MAVPQSGVFSGVFRIPAFYQLCTTCTRLNGNNGVTAYHGSITPVTSASCRVLYRRNGLEQNLLFFFTVEAINGFVSVKLIANKSFFCSVISSSCPSFMGIEMRGLVSLIFLERDITDHHPSRRTGQSIYCLLIV